MGIHFDKSNSEWVGKKFTPPPGNNAFYGQDFRFFRGLPIVEFTVINEMSHGVMVAAPRYGDRDFYGNGKIYIAFRDLLPLLESAELRAYDPVI